MPLPTPNHSFKTRGGPKATPPPQSLRNGTLVNCPQREMLKSAQSPDCHTITVIKEFYLENCAHYCVPR